MKYLYPYECEKLKLSTPQELQAAIDGNRREGRRSSYGYDLSPGPTLIPSSHHPHLNGGLFNGKLGGSAAGGVFRNEQLIPSSLLKYSTMTENGWNQKDLLGMLSHNSFSCFEKKIIDLKTSVIYLPYLKKRNRQRLMVIHTVARFLVWKHSVVWIHCLWKHAESLYGLELMEFQRKLSKLELKLWTLLTFQNGDLLWPAYKSCGSYSIINYVSLINIYHELCFKSIKNCPLLKWWFD